MSIVRVGLAETKNFSEGYDAIFGGKKAAAVKGKPKTAKVKSAKTKSATSAAKTTAVKKKASAKKKTAKE